jgi:hypothetical protein
MKNVAVPSKRQNWGGRAPSRRSKPLIASKKALELSRYTATGRPILARGPRRWTMRISAQFRPDPHQSLEAGNVRRSSVIASCLWCYPWRTAQRNNFWLTVGTACSNGTRVGRTSIWFDCVWIFMSVWRARWEILSRQGNAAILGSKGPKTYAPFWKTSQAYIRV